VVPGSVIAASMVKVSSRLVSADKSQIFPRNITDFPTQHHRFSHATSQIFPQIYLLCLLKFVILLYVQTIYYKIHRGSPYRYTSHADRRGKTERQKHTLSSAYRGRYFRRIYGYTGRSCYAESGTNRPFGISSGSGQACH